MKNMLPAGLRGAGRSHALLELLLEGKHHPPSRTLPISTIFPDISALVKSTSDTQQDSAFAIGAALASTAAMLAGLACRSSAVGAMFGKDGLMSSGEVRQAARHCWR